MKTLNVNQMEHVNGGLVAIDCANQLVVGSVIFILIGTDLYPIPKECYDA